MITYVLKASVTLLRPILAALIDDLVKSSPKGTGDILKSALLSINLPVSRSINETIKVIKVILEKNHTHHVKTTLDTFISV